MHIVVEINGEEMIRRHVPDEALYTSIEGYSSRQMYEHRQQVIGFLVQQIKQLDAKLFSNCKGLEVYLLFESKLNRMSEEEIEEVLETPAAKLVA